MKKWILIFSVLFFFTSCAQKSQYEFEDKLYACLKENTTHLNLDEVIIAVENEWNKTGNLKSSTNSNLHEILTKIIETGKFDFSLPTEIKHQLNQVNFQDARCSSFLVESAFPQNTRSFKIFLGFKEMFGRISDAESLNPNFIASEFLKVLNKKDLQHPLIKLIFYKSISQFSPAENSGVVSKLPAWSDDQPDISKIKPRNVYTISVGKNQGILVRDKKIELNQLKDKVKSFISNPNREKDLSESPTKAIISLKSQRETPYETYLKVLDEIRAAFWEMRNDKAEELYNLMFDELDEARRKKVRNMFPLVITESESTGF